ncbi:ABC transporter substrate-binding protein [Paradesulfitobacterium aromaticivorans]
MRTNRQKTNKYFLVLSLVIMLVITGCGSVKSSTVPTAASGQNDGTQQKVKVGFAFVSWSGYQIPEYVAMEKGFFAQEGLEGVPYNTKSNDEIVKLMLSGEAPFESGGTTDSMLLAVQKGAKIKGLMSKAIASPYDLVVSPQINSVADLKGKKVAVSQIASASTVMLIDMTSRLGLKSDEYQRLEVGGTNERYSALTNGGVQGTLLNPPSNFQAIDKGYKVLGTFTQTTPLFDYLPVTVTVTVKYEQEHPEVVQKFVNAMVRSLIWLQDPNNKKEAVAIIAKTLKLQEDLAGKTYDYFISQNKTFSTDGTPNPEAYQKMIDVAVNLKLLDKQIDLDDFYDTSYLKKALKEIKK